MTSGRQAARMAIAMAIAFSAGHWPAAQSPASAPPTPAAISGSVVDGATGRPIENAIVTLTRRTGGPLSFPTRVLTDAQGRFVFKDIPPGEGYSVGATGMVICPPTTAVRRSAARPSGSRCESDSGSATRGLRCGARARSQERCSTNTGNRSLGFTSAPLRRSWSLARRTTLPPRPPDRRPRHVPDLSVCAKDGTWSRSQWCSTRSLTA